MKIAVEGCAHGELDMIYSTIQYLEQQEGFKIDLLICCGDFQASRNEEDLHCMAVPPKYKKLCTFYKYYTGEKVAPVLTIFVGGNHEASNYLQELPYGGWVAPKIYYLGYAGVINIAGIRIGGLSGIYKGKDYMKGHFEHAPFSDNSKRSVYHIRNLEVFRLKQISEPLDIFLSHDWPNGVWEYGNKKQLIRFKPFFERDIESGELGSKPTGELLHKLKPDFWFSAHLHCKFAAVIPHECGKITKFLALDKCLPNRRFLQIFDIPHNASIKTEICYDLEWLTILRMTNHLLSVKNSNNYLPGPNSNEKWCFTPVEEDKTGTLVTFGDNLVIPENFVKTAEGFNSSLKSKSFKLPEAVSNPQTVLFCKKLSLDDPLSILLNLDESTSVLEVTNSEVSLDKPTFIESDISINTPKKMSLNLPKPVNESNETSDDRIEEISVEKKVADVADEEKSADESRGFTSKKFIRRNAAIYKNEN